jgi:hypothetical protein
VKERGRLELLGADEDDIKMDVEEIGRDAVYWINLVQYREKLWGCCEYVNEPAGPGNCEEFLY